MLSKIFLVLLSFASANALALEFASDARASTVIELYTSEGCSSCPPADRWLAQFNSRPELFSSLVPMAFHVDYWDYIGWRDPFAKKMHSQRQRALAKAGILDSVYTPAFVINSSEWRGWFNRQRDLPPRPTSQPGVLRGELLNNTLTVSFASDHTLDLHIAYLGMGLVSRVSAGENNQRTLKHDFVVLEQWRAAPGNRRENITTWALTTKKIPEKGQQKTALVLWLTEPNSANIIQATGSLLPGI